ncbi:MAG TPA: hypothetical protein VF598_03815, partial [Hymenobacter sp.]
MRTPEMSDEELDALFRRGAETYPDEVHLGAWSRMEDKLNEATLNRLLRQKIVRLFAIEILLLGLTLLVWHTNWQQRLAFVPAPTTKQTTSISAHNQGAPMAGNQQLAPGSSVPRSTTRNLASINNSVAPTSQAQRNSSVAEAVGKPSSTLSTAPSPQAHKAVYRGPAWS